MKKRIRNGIAMLLILVLSVVQIIPAQAASGTFRYYTLTPLSSASSSARSDMLSYFSQMGYTRNNFLYPTPTTLKNGLKTATVTYIHGHGSAGLVQCQDASGDHIGYLYSSKASTSGSNQYLRSLSSTALSSEKLVVYMTCNSATASGSQTSMMQETYSRGAKCVIGFNNSVANAEYWTQYFTINLKNGMNIKSSILQANSQYTLVYPTHATQSSSPTKGCKYVGNTSQKLN